MHKDAKPRCLRILPSCGTSRRQAARHSASAAAMAAGVDNSNLQRCLRDEFERVASGGRKYLVVDEVLALRLPCSSWPVAFSHLGILHALDRRARRTHCRQASALRACTFCRCRFRAKSRHTAGCLSGGVCLHTSPHALTLAATHASLHTEKKCLLALKCSRLARECA